MRRSGGRRGLRCWRRQAGPAGGALPRPPGPWKGRASARRSPRPPGLWAPAAQLPTPLGCKVGLGQPRPTPATRPLPPRPMDPLLFLGGVCTPTPPPVPSPGFLAAPLCSAGDALPSASAPAAAVRARFSGSCTGGGGAGEKGGVSATVSPRKH